MLKALRLRKKIDDAKKQLDALRAKDADFEKREAELAADIEAAESEEDQAAVDAAIESFDKEKEENDTAKAGLEKEISDMERELQEVEAAQEARSAPVAAGTEKRTVIAAGEERGAIVMDRRDVRMKFFGLDVQERQAFLADEGVKGFLGQVRTCISERRALTNVGLTFPDAMLPLLRESVEANSKLISRVTLRRVGGIARQNIMGSIPEAVWTEMCAKLNELSLGFNQTEVDGFKVGGYFAVCNAALEDSDLNLASELVTAISKAIAKALDKAIVYGLGSGSKMPLGIVTRLAQTSQPAGYSVNDRAWVDYSGTSTGTPHVITGTNKTGDALFKEILANTGVIANDYFDNGITWLMNRKTHAALLVESIGRNANATIVAGINNTMPILGGEIVELPFIPDNNIVVGYLDAYLLAERAGTVLESSEHYRFIEDQTVFKGTARYDGKPVIPEAFAVMSITSTAPTTVVSFPPDSANTPPVDAGGGAGGGGGSS